MFDPRPAARQVSSTARRRRAAQLAALCWCMHDAFVPLSPVLKFNNSDFESEVVPLSRGDVGAEEMKPRRAVGASYETDDDSRAMEYADILARRVVFSRAHSAVCTSMLAAGVVEVLWIVAHSFRTSRLPDHPLFVVIESYVTLGLFGEILLRAAMQRREFCRKWANIFDVAVAGVSVVSSALFYAGLETPAEMLLGTIIVTARILFRLMRLVAVSRSLRENQRSADRKLDVCMDAIDVETG